MHLPHFSSWVGDAGRTVSLFYAQSWALTHFLILGETSGTRRDPFTRYIALVIAGKDGLETAREAFGDLEVLSRELQKYSRTLGRSRRVGLDWWY